VNPALAARTIAPIFPAVTERERANASLGLDALRTVGALLVFVVHVLPFAFGTAGREMQPENGRLGVYMFFALSGYLLTHQLLPGVDLPRYFVARAARIMPAYLVAVVGITILTGTPFAIQNPVRYLTMTQAWFPPSYGPLNPTWTLSVEALFYVALPVLLIVLRHRLGPLVLVAASILSLMLIGDPSRMDAAPLMVWAFVPGMLVAWAEPRIALPRWLALPGAAVAALAIAIGSAGLAAVGAAILIAGLRNLGGRQLRIPSNLTYAFYLWHSAIIIVLAGLVSGRTLILVAFLASAGVAALSWFGLERPIMRTLTRRGRAHPIELPSPPASI
jgi:peptidoglycan/LPS O-acetylase OafA/YrhL